MGGSWQASSARVYLVWLLGSFDLSENGAVVRVGRVNEGWRISLREEKALGGMVSAFIKF